MKRTWMLAIAAGAAVAVLGVGAVWAQSSGQSNPGSSFLDRVAQKLGIDSPKLQQAIVDTRNEDIDAAVANGDLTQKQADALKQRAAQNPQLFGDNGFGPGMHGKGPGGFGFEFGLGLGPGMGMDGAAQQLADFLGVTTDQLKTELQAGNATLATVAQAHGKSRDDLKSFITNAAKTKLDQAVQNGDLTQKREDDMLSKLNDTLDTLIDSKFIGRIAGKLEHRGPAQGGHSDDNGDGATPPATTPAPQSGSGSPSSQF